jgi:hypothetical protein
MGTLVYRIAAFDATGRKVALFPIPMKLVRKAKQIAGIQHPFPDFAGEKPLSPNAANHIAELIGKTVKPNWRCYLSPVATDGSVIVPYE